MLLYQNICETLTWEIRQRIFPVGAKLPTESELSKRFSTSRHTVREALRLLQARGLIVRRQGSGSVVTAADPQQQFTSSISTLEGLMQYASRTRLEVLAVDKIVVEEPLSRFLSSDNGSVWIRVSALRRAEESRKPIGYAEIYLPDRFENIVRDIGAVRTAVYRLVEEKFPVSVATVHQTIEAAVADSNVASRLEIAVSEPLLRITRRYESAEGELIEVADNVHPADGFRYEMTLKSRASS